jgi:hypothetical protein
MHLRNTFLEVSGEKSACTCLSGGYESREKDWWGIIGEIEDEKGRQSRKKSRST